MKTISKPLFDAVNRDCSIADSVLDALIYSLVLSSNKQCILRTSLVTAITRATGKDSIDVAFRVSLLCSTSILNLQVGDRKRDLVRIGPSGQKASEHQKFAVVLASIDPEYPFPELPAQPAKVA